MILKERKVRRIKKVKMKNVIFLKYVFKVKRITKKTLKQNSEAKVSPEG